LLGENRKKTYVEKEKVIAGEKPKENLLGKGEGNCWGKTEKTLDNKPVSIIIEINTLCSGAT